MSGGFCPNILRVDLTAGTVGKEPLPPDEVVRAFMGGTGLGVYYLLREAPMDVKATDPRAPLIFMTGPLAGTAAPSSANWVTICFHYSIRYAAGIGHGHGFWAAYLKHAGYEGILIRGRAQKAVYLWIDDDRVELRDASQYWGLGTRETERRIKAELGGEEAKISVACIGPGGEALMPGASVKADRNHGAGKGSPGAIMGSKNLKAIAVRGTGRVPIARPDPFNDVTGRWQSLLASLPAGSTAETLYNGGIIRKYDERLGVTHRIAFKNLTDPEGGKALGRNLVEASHRWKVIPKPSYNCPIGCAYDLQMTDGPYSGFTASLCGGAEQFEGAAGMIGITDASEAVALTDLYDDMGLEAGTFGAIIAAAFEAYNAGLLSRDDFDGLDLGWGNFDAAVALIGKTIKREGVGAKLAAGISEMAHLMGASREITADLRKRAVHIKGAGINIHDWRASQSIIFGYLVAGSGPAHFGMGQDHRPIQEGGIVRRPGESGVAETLEQALARVDGVRRSAFFKLWWDSLGICWFAVSGIDHMLRTTVEAVNHATGWAMTSEEALMVGERITSALRLIYEKRGFRKEDEFDYGRRYIEPASAGPAKDHTLEPWLPKMVDEYYRQMGWDVATGYVTAPQIERLGLGGLAEERG